MAPELHILLKLFSKLVNQLFSLTFVVLMTTLTLEPCCVAAEAPANPHYGGTLRLASYGQPAALDPFNTSDTISAHLMDLVFNRLIKTDENGQFIPDLAKRWEISENGLVYTFHLRKGIKFHDGTPCTSEDVLRSVHLFSRGKIISGHQGMFDVVKSWEAPAPLVFRIILKEPYPPLFTRLCRIYIVSRAYGESSGGDSGRSGAPIGTGAFRLSQWEKSGKITFMANPDYYDGRPYLDSVVVLPIRKGRVWSSFLRGEVDMAFDLTQENYKAIQEDPSFRVFRILSGSVYVLTFNFHDPLMQEKWVREAIAHGINRRELINEVEGGDAAAASGPFPPNSWAFNSEVMPAAHDPRESEMILQSAGFVKTGRVFERGGKKLTVKMMVDGKDQKLFRMAKLIRQQLNEIGVRMVIDAYDDFQDFVKRAYGQGDFQSYLFAFQTGLQEPDTMVTYWYSGAKTPYNLGGYKNPAVDDLIERGRKVHDPASRTAIYHELHQVMAQDKPSLFIYFPYKYFAVSSRVVIPQTLYSSFVPFYVLERAYVDSTNQHERG